MNNYSLLETVELKEHQGIGYVYKHNQSQATVVIISNNDKNKVFSACFPTPVTNDKGIPHIIEHSLLCGSKKYPLKDPFVELMKGSMNTFLNAMTYDDMTVFPVASMNDKDFNNLMDVYLDAVFHPLAIENKKIFMQEGWHYEIDEEGLFYNGVVFNEMKGYMASPDYLLEYYIKKALYPNSCFAYHSGGKPKAIVDLSYEEFCDFYKKHYHPSQCLLFIYGDIDVEERLDYLDKNYLSHYKALDYKKYQYPLEYKPIEKSDNTYYSNEDYAYFSYSTIFSHKHSLLDLMVMEIIDYALVSSQGAKIRTQLLDEDIGQDVYTSITLNANAPSFSIICKNAKEEKKERFFEIVKENIEHLSFDENKVLAALHMLQFQYRELESSTPKGLSLNQQILLKWLYHEDNIFELLEAQKILKELEDLIKNHQFESYAKKLLSGVSSCLSLLPSQDIDGFEEELNTIYQKLTDEQKQQINNDCLELIDYQDSEEDESIINCIPILSKEDLPSKVQSSVNEEKDIEGIKLLYHNLDTKGIGYLKFNFDLRYLSLDLLPYASLLSVILGMVDTNNYSYSDLSNEIFMHTGGIGYSTAIYDAYRKMITKPCFEINTKFLYHEVEDAISFINETIFNSKFNNSKRIKEVLVQEKASLESQFMNNAHSIAYHESRKDFCLSDYYLDKMDYLGYYHFICDLLDHFDIEEFNKIFSNLTVKIFNKKHLIISYAGEKDSYDKVICSLESLLKALDDSETSIMYIPTLSKKESYKAYTIPSQVNYVALSGYSHVDDSKIAAYQTLQHILKCDYLWHHIRVKGGAYGCFALDNNYNMLSLISYRDPHLKESLDVYKKCLDYIKNLNVDERTLQQYIIGTINERENVLSNHQIAIISFNRYMMEIDEDFLNQVRQDTINMSLDDIKDLALIIEDMLNHSSYCVIGNEDDINENKDLFTTIQSLI